MFCVQNHKLENQIPHLTIPNSEFFFSICKQNTMPCLVFGKQIVCRMGSLKNLLNTFLYRTFRIETTGKPQNRVNAKCYRHNDCEDSHNQKTF